ncbi:unnamed protein product, partial [Allacma fusca]
GPSERGQFMAAGELHTVTDMNFTGGLGSGNVGTITVGMVADSAENFF